MRASFKSFDNISNEKEFSSCALALFEYQFEHNKVYRSYCDLINVNPSGVKKISEIPFFEVSCT